MNIIEAMSKQQFIRRISEPNRVLDCSTNGRWIRYYNLNSEQILADDRQVLTPIIEDEDIIVIKNEKYKVLFE